MVDIAYHGNNSLLSGEAPWCCSMLFVDISVPSVLSSLSSLSVCLSVCLSVFLTGHTTCSKLFGLESQKLELNNILVQVHRDQEILINLSFFTSLFSAVKFHSCPSKDQYTQKLKQVF